MNESVSSLKHGAEHDRHEPGIGLAGQDIFGHNAILAADQGRKYRQADKGSVAAHGRYCVEHDRVQLPDGKFTKACRVEHGQLGR